jgi:hypothetical protein
MPTYSRNYKGVKKVLKTEKLLEKEKQPRIQQVVLVLMMK